MNAPKLDRFKRVAAPRVQRVLDALDSLEKCSSKANYEYDPADVKKMLAAIKTALRRVENSFSDDGLKKKQFNF